jgi:hypothetical protein
VQVDMLGQQLPVVVSAPECGCGGSSAAPTTVTGADSLNEGAESTASAK